MDTDQREAAVEPELQTTGSILRRCRELNKISLKDAAEATRIGKNYLQALEDDRPQDFPSPAYLKGFLKTYAIYLGLDGEELLQLANRTADTPAADHAPASRAYLRFDSFNWQRLILPAVLLGALIVSAFLLSPPSPARPVQPVLVVALPVAPAPAVQAPVSSAVKLPNAEAPQPETVPVVPVEVKVAPPKSPDSFMVRMKVTRNSTLSVIIDDAAAQDYDLASGDLIEWKAGRTIALDLSDAGSVEIELNNTPLKLQVPSGKQAYIVLDAQGIRH